MQTGQQPAGTAGTSASRVRDPVTGGQVTLKNAPENPEELPRGQNVLSLAFPPPELEAQRKYLFKLFSTTVNRMTLAFALVPIAAFALAPRVLTARPLLLLIPSLSIPAAVTFLWKYRMQSKGQDDADRRVWDVERRRGFMAGTDIDGDGIIEADERIKESAEWFNSLFRGLWPIINPDMFSSTVEMLEDIMQSSVPTYIHSVRIPDLGLGANPIRITAIRALPDSEMDSVTNSLKEEEREYIQGEHVNWELSFAYRAAPNRTKWSEKAENFHLLLEFYLGIKGIAAVPIPVWAEITGMVGTARMRIELIPDPPFIKHTLITLVGLPKVSVSITPIHKRLLPNMMDIPFLSRFITQSIDSVAKSYVAPKSLMLDLQQMLSGDGIKRDTEHIGVVVIHIHQVKIAKAARQKIGDIDAYVNLCLSPMNKTQYTTRMISKTLEPIFEETAVLLVDANAAKVGEKVTLEVWDSDRFTDDDFIGRVEVDVAELISNHNTTFRRSSTMRNAATELDTGTVEFTIGFFSKVTPGRRDGSPDVPQDIVDSEGFKKIKRNTLNNVETAVCITTPSDDFLSGILGIQLHEIRELGLKASNVAMKNEGRGSSDKPEGEQELESDRSLPSSYCTVMLNDEAIFRTRTKTMTATPFFNTSTERFVKDWKAAHICVVVRDSRMRETDPIIGMVFFKLSELFKKGSMATGAWSLQYGTGFGRIHLSFVFRPVQLTMPPSLIGFDTGTVEIKGVTVRFIDPTMLENVEIRLATSGGFTKIKKMKRKLKKEDDSDDETSTFEQTLIHLPILTRYHSAIILKARKKGLFNRSTLALGTVWLRDLVDNHADGIVKATLWRGGDLQELRENYSKPEENVLGNHGEAIGEVELKVVFKPGVSDVHEKEMLEDPDTKNVWEEYVILKKEGLRSNIGRQDVIVQVMEMHQQISTPGAVAAEAGV